MQKFSLEALGHQLLGRAGAAGGGHTADTVVGGLAARADQGQGGP